MKTRAFGVFWRGFTLLELLIVVAILGLILALAIPNFLKSRTVAQRNLCIENLTQIEAAKQTWGLEANKQPGATPGDADLFGSTSYIKVKPVCPAGGEYTINPVGQNAECTIDGHDL